MGGNIHEQSLGIYRNHSKVWYTMSMGAYDEHEHERREEKASTVDADFDQERSEFQGSVTYDSGESADELLNQFQKLNDE